MDDAAFQDWSDTLTEIRKKRQAFIDNQLKELADSFGPDQFFNLASRSVEEIMDVWFGYEQKSWEAHPPEDPAAAVEIMRSEMDSILDFEIEAVDRDKGSVLSQITWDDKAVNKSEPTYLALINDLRKEFRHKINSLGGKSKKRKVEPLPSVVQSRQTGGGSRGGSGLGLLLMFFLGLLFGGAPSLFFMEGSKKAEKKFEEERRKLLAEQHTMADNLTVLHESFDQLAKGKIRNLPELDKEISNLKADVLDERRALNSTYQSERERALKKYSGDRLEKVLEELDEEQEQNVAELKSREASILEPLLKQRKILSDLVNR